MRARVTLQEESRVADGAGGSTLSWQDVATLWAAIIPLPEKEQLQAEKLTARAPYKMTLRYDARIDTAKRFLWGARILNIRSVRDADARQHILEIIAEEGVGS